jgi:hypothetical protein
MSADVAAASRLRYPHRMNEDAAASLVLEYLQRVLGELRGAAVSQDVAQFGVPPGEFVVEQREYSTSRIYNTGDPVRRWRVSEVAVTPATLELLPQPVLGNGMYYLDSGRADFAVYQDGSRVRIGWYVGPRFGRGYDAALSAGPDGQHELGPLSPTWWS